MMRIIAVTLIVTWSALASADGKGEARPHVAAADTHFKLGQFKEALAEYSKAYELYPTPPLLFNLGQCYRNLKDWEHAIFFFEGYLRERPDAPNRPLVEDLLRESRAALESQKAAEATQRTQAEQDRAAEAERLRIEVARADAARRLDEERIAAARRAAEDDRVRSERAHNDPYYRKWWFWTAVGGAAIAIGGGTTYYFANKTTVVDPMGTLGGLDRR